MNYLHDEARAHMRMNQLLREASVDRLLPQSPDMTHQMLATVGTWMINMGERLTRLSALDENDKKLNVIETANG